MPTINSNYLNLTAGYLFPEIGRRVSAFAEANPDAPIIKLGIGDVTEPLPEACRVAMQKAIQDQGKNETFHGYGPEQGYGWLRSAIAENDYKSRGCDISAGEIFVSDGSKCDTGNILDIFGQGNSIAVTDPVYPVYVDTNVMVGNAGPANEQGEYSGLVYLRATADNSFTPAIPDEKVDLIYLCYPNNPTGAVASKAYLKQWVDYANRHGSVILFDAAYEAFITDPDIPHSIYEIEGARTCAIEFPQLLQERGLYRGHAAVSRWCLRNSSAKTLRVMMWRCMACGNRRQSTKFNGASYIIQRGAEAVYSEAGQEQVKGLVQFYLDNAKLILDGTDFAGSGNALAESMRHTSGSRRLAA